MLQIDSSTPLEKHQHPKWLIFLDQVKKQLSF